MAKRRLREACRDKSVRDENLVAAYEVCIGAAAVVAFFAARWLWRAAKARV